MPVLPPVMTATLPCSFCMSLWMPPASEGYGFLFVGRVYIGRVNVFRYFGLLVLVSFALRAAELKPETIAAFDRYVKLTEDGFAKNQGFENFLWLDHHTKEKSMVWLQQSIVSPLQTLDQDKEIEVPDGVIQHWLGVVYLENADVDHVRGLLMNLAGYKDFFKQQIVESKVNKQQGDQYDFFLR